MLTLYCLDILDIKCLYSRHSRCPPGWPGTSMDTFVTQHSQLGCTKSICGAVAACSSLSRPCQAQHVESFRQYVNDWKTWMILLIFIMLDFVFHCAGFHCEISTSMPASIVFILAVKVPADDHQGEAVTTAKLLTCSGCQPCLVSVWGPIHMAQREHWRFLIEVF